MEQMQTSFGCYRFVGVLIDAPSGLERRGELELCSGVSLLGCGAEPLRRFARVLVVVAAGGEPLGEFVLAFGASRFRQKAEDLDHLVVE